MALNQAVGERRRLPLPSIAGLWQFMVAGYLTFGRSFAYLGVPPLYVGELFLAVHVLANPRRWVHRFIDGFMRLGTLEWAIVATIGWGVFEVVRSLLLGHAAVSCLRPFAFNYYPLCVAVGVGVAWGRGIPWFIRFWKRLSVYYLIYCVVHIGFFGLQLKAPWNGAVNLFNIPALPGLVPVGTLALWPYLRRWRWRYVAIVVGVAPIFFAAGRGTFLSVLAGTAMVALSSTRRLVLVSGVAAGVVTLMILVGPFIAGESPRSENLDPIVIVGRLVATIDETAAYRMLLDRGYAGAAEEMLVAHGTAEWRKDIWRNALIDLEAHDTLLLGRGFGVDISSITPDGQEIHTPHNFLIYAIYYTGAIGLTLYLVMLAGLTARVMRVPDQSLRVLLLATMLMMATAAAVGNMFETPTAAIPFYLFMGAGIGAAFGWEPRLA